MLFNHFSRKEVKDIIRRVSKDYEEQIATLRGRANELIDENRQLSARLSELEGDRNNVSDALITSIDAGKKLEEKSLAYVENQMRGIRLIADRSRRLAEDLKAKYPAESDCAELNEFFDRLEELLSGETEGYMFEQDKNAEITDADLENICKELGIKDDGQGERKLVLFEDDED